MSLFLDSVSNRRNLRLLTTSSSLINVNGDVFYHRGTGGIIATTTTGVATTTIIPSSILSIYDIGNYGRNDISLACIRASISSSSIIVTLTGIQRAIAENRQPSPVAIVPNDEEIFSFIDADGAIYYTYPTFNPTRVSIGSSDGSRFTLPTTANKYDFTKSYFLENSTKLNYTDPTWNSYKSVDLPTGTPGATSQSLCETPLLNFSSRGTACAFTSGFNGMYRIQGSGGIPLIDYININMNFSTPVPGSNYITRVANNGMVWMIYQSSSQIYRKFSPNFGSNWYDQSTISGTFLSGLDDDLRKEFKISEDGKNHIIRTSTGIYISTNYGY